MTVQSPLLIDFIVKTAMTLIEEVVDADHTVFKLEHVIGIILEPWLSHLKTICFDVFRYIESEHRLEVKWFRMFTSSPSLQFTSLTYKNGAANIIYTLDFYLLNEINRHDKPFPTMTKDHHQLDFKSFFTFESLKLGLSHFNRRYAYHTRTILKSYDEIMTSAKNKCLHLLKLVDGDENRSDLTMSFIDQAKHHLEVVLVPNIYMRLSEYYFQGPFTIVLAEDREQLKKKLAELSTILDDYRQRNDELDAKLKEDTLEFKNTITELQDHKSRCALLVKELVQKHKEETNNAQREIEDLRHAAEMQFEEYKSIKRDYDFVLDDLGASQACIDDLKGQMRTTNAEKDRLQQQLAAVLEARVSLSNGGIAQVQRDPLVPTLSNLESQVKSLHSTVGIPIIKEMAQLKGMTAAEDRAVDIATRTHTKVKMSLNQRVGAAKQQLFGENREDSGDVRALLVSFLSNGTAEARKCRHEVFNFNWITPLTHSDNCKDMFGDSLLNRSPKTKNLNPSTEIKYNFCCCDLLHTFSLMALYGFEVFNLTKDRDPTQEELALYDKIQAQEPSPTGSKYRVIWPPIRLPSTGAIVQGKIEIYEQGIETDWALLSSEASSDM